MSRVVPDGRHRASCMGTGLMEDITYVGLDVHKATVCAAVAEGGRSGGVRQLGIFENRPEVLIKMATRLARGGSRLIPGLSDQNRCAQSRNPRDIMRQG